MAPRRQQNQQRADEIELLRRSSRDSPPDSFDDPDHDPLLDDPLDPLDFSTASHRPRSPWPISWLASLLSSRGAHTRTPSQAYSRPHRTCLRRRGARQICYLVLFLSSLAVILIIVASIIRPSYTNLPRHYIDLLSNARVSKRANPHNEKIFIAANIIDEDLIRGAWGENVRNLITLLGQEHVFLSIYENDSGPGTTAALTELQTKVECENSIVSEHLHLDSIPTITLPSGEKRIKRVAYLAEVRNRALRPLDDPSSPAHSIVFDKILFLNDVIFSPLDAAQLLFSTNLDPTTKRASYRAACAIDFINPIKFYDTYASRDIEGYSMGLPFYPFFTTAGSAYSRKDVLAEKDAVRVRSCWGGMVAFDAAWFQKAPSLTTVITSNSTSTPTSTAAHDDESLTRRLDPSSTDASPLSTSSPATPIRFRSAPDLFWDASECCLIHADLQPTLPSLLTPPTAPTLPDPEPQSLIFMNPFVRVAYDASTFAWLATTRRWERLYSLPHLLVNQLVGLPWYNPRRDEKPGETWDEEVWDEDEGDYAVVERTVGPGGFCGVRKLAVLKTEEERRAGGGGKMWENLRVPGV